MTDDLSVQAELGLQLNKAIFFRYWGAFFGFESMYI